MGFGASRAEARQVVRHNGILVNGKRVNIPSYAVRPGDVVVADDDGVVFVSAGRAAEVAKACDAREAKEAVVRERLNRGELGLDIYGMRETLAKQGLVYLDSIDEP